MKPNPMSYALKKLAGRSYSVKEMKEALNTAGYDYCSVEEVIERLIDIGYLNDRIYAQKIYDYHTRIKPCGPVLLPLKLRSKGIRDDTIAEVMEYYTREKELEIIELLAVKLLKKNKEPKIDLLIRQLQRKGFTHNNISKYIVNNWPDFNFSIINED